MSFELKIQNDLKAAMRNKNQAALRALRAVKSAILLAKTEKGGSAEISEEDGVKIIQKLVKQRNESIDIYKKQNRIELAQDEIDEVSNLEVYLPKQLTSEELESLVKSVITKTGAQSKADMGKVMGMAMKEAAGRADGKAISALVGKLLS
ncbi:MAG: GatB/YqeY domain-containing protein [Bacteroidia bacterium]